MRDVETPHFLEGYNNLSSPLGTQWPLLIKGRHRDSSSPYITISENGGQQASIGYIKIVCACGDQRFARCMCRRKRGNGIGLLDIELREAGENEA